LGFRTNAGAFNPGDAAVSVTFDLFDGSAAAGHSVERTVAAHSGVQVNQIFREAGVESLTTSNGVIAVHATGPVLSYASVVDTNTSDPYFVVGAQDPAAQPTIVSTSTPTRTPTATPTRTPIAIMSTRTATRTRTPIPMTPTRTATPLPPTSTPTPSPTLTPGPPHTYTVTLGCSYEVCGGTSFDVFQFSPSSIRIHIGDTINWVRRTGFCSGAHSVTSGSPSAPDGKFDSGTLNGLLAFSHTFTQTGTYPYFCSPGHVQLDRCIECGCGRRIVHESGTVIVDP
jgi:hypothetical protein